MRPSEIENWTLKIIDQLRANERIEDTRVEIKTIWIDPQDAARIIAGQSNAARGEPILWIIGIDEKNPNPIGVRKEELAVWWEQVISRFEGVYPSMTDINVSIDNKTVVSLLFETDRAPYVIKNPNFGKEKDKIRFEVPWREGTSTRTAGRADLLRLLVPILHKPKIEILAGELKCSKNRDKEKIFWNLDTLQLYVEPAIGEQINFVFHRCEVTFEIPNIIKKTVFSDIRIAPPYVYDTKGARAYTSLYDIPQKPDSVTSAHTQSEMIFHGPGRGNLRGKAETELTDELKFGNTIAKIDAILVYSHGETPVTLHQELHWQKPDSNEDWLLGKWIL